MLILEYLERLKQFFYAPNNAICGNWKLLSFSSIESNDFMFKWGLTLLWSIILHSSVRPHLNMKSQRNLDFSAMFSIPFHSSLLQMEARTVGVEPETPPPTWQDASPSHGYPTNWICRWYRVVKLWWVGRDTVHGVKPLVFINNALTGPRPELLVRSRILNSWSDVWFRNLGWASDLKTTHVTTTNKRLLTKEVLCAPDDQHLQLV